MTRIVPKAQTAAWGEATIVHAAKPVLPLTAIRLIFRGGAALDPPGKEGLAALTARMLERGAGARTREQIADAIETMGGHLSTAAGLESIRIDAAVLSRSLPELMSIAADLALAPAFDAEELEKAKDETIAELALFREEDRDLADAYLRCAVFAEPFGRFTEGTEASIPRITRDDVVDCWRRHFHAANLVVGAAGDIELGRLTALLDKNLGAIPRGRARAVAPPILFRERKRLEALLVDKPDRTQTQIFFGWPAVEPRDPRFLPYLVANHAFGGMFTSRLMQEVRVKRGWSYGAHSRLELSRGRALAGLWTFPSNDDTIPCVRLLLDLLRDLREQGIRGEELDAAKSHLMGTVAFEVETPEQLVQRRIQEIILDLPDDWTDRLLGEVEAVRMESVQGALRELIRPEAGALVLVCTADRFRDELRERFPEIGRLDIVPFDTEEPNRWTLAWER